MFALVRLEPPILLRQRCDRANIRGTHGYGFWGRTDTRRAAAYTSVNRDFAASRGALSGTDQRCKGLAVRVAPSGAKTWDLAYRIRGTTKTRRLSLGRTTDVSLEQARERANELTSAARGGRDLIGEEGEARDAAASRITVEKLIDLYLRRRVAGRLRTAKTIESRLKRTLAPILQRYAADVRRRDIREILDVMADQGKGREAEKRRQVCTAMFRWALSQDIVVFLMNPRLDSTTYQQSPSLGSARRKATCAFGQAPWPCTPISCGASNPTASRRLR